MTTRTTWWLEPREPLVFGTGARSSALAPRAGAWLPTQATAAGTVRSALIPRGQRVGPEEARDLLEIAIDGPWLGRRVAGAERPFEVWVPMPVDAAVVDSGEEDAEGKVKPGPLLRSRLVEPEAHGGTLGTASEEAPPLLLHVPAKDSDDRKTRPPKLPFWPLDEAVRWALTETTRRDDGKAWREPEANALLRENRVHVKIERGPYTAEPEALFSTPGIRFAQGFGLLVDVRDGRNSSTASSPVPSSGRLVTLGGEGRTSVLTTHEARAWPLFSHYRAAYERRAEEIVASGDCLGLHLQLVTPGCFGGWRPDPWPEGLPGRLQAVAMDRFQPVSGWDLQNRRPRAVRRLVPAGGVYVFGRVATPEELVQLCETWWTRSLSDGMPADLDSFLAAPVQDGYGRVLPSPCRIPAGLVESQSETRP